MTNLYNAHGHTIPNHATHDMTADEFFTEVDTWKQDIPPDEFADYKNAFDTAWFTDTPVMTLPTPVLRPNGNAFHILYVDNPYSFRPVGTVSDGVTIA